MKGKSTSSRDEERDRRYSARSLGRNPNRSGRVTDGYTSYYAPIPPEKPSWSQGNPVEIEDEEVEATSAAACRICLESDGDPGDELISPCMCKGTQQFVHRSCLDHWRSVKEGFAFSHCTTCKAQYHLQVNFLEGRCWRTIKFRMFVAKDIILVFLALQTLIVVLGGITFLLDIHGKFRNFFSDAWGSIFTNHPVTFYYCTGVVVFFVLLGFFGLIAQCSSYGGSSDTFSQNTPSTGGSGNVSCCNGPCFINCSDSGEECLPLLILCVFLFAVLGIFYGLVGATMAIQRIWQQHIHILTKRKLTEEYVVEDLHGCYTEPKLDREHEERLRSLNLL